MTSTFDTLTGVWSASGAIADVNTLLTGLTFTPALNYDSNFNIFTSVDDGVAAAITGTKVMTGTAVNDAPTYNPVALDAIDLNSGARLITEAELLANVIDPDGDPLTATGLTISSGLGTLVDNGNGTWSYTPATNDDGSVEFTYTVSDGVLSTVNLAVMDISLIAVDNSSSGSTDNSASITVSHTTSGTNRLMLVGISGELNAESVRLRHLQWYQPDSRRG